MVVEFMATSWKWKVFLLELGFVECMASNGKWQLFLLELGLLSAWLPIESEKCFYLSLGCWVHVVCVFGQLCNEGKGKMKVEIGKKMQDEQDDMCFGESKMSKMTYVLRKWSQIGHGKRTQKTTSFERVTHHFQKWCKMTYVQCGLSVAKTIPKATHTHLKKVFSRNMILLKKWRKSWEPPFLPQNSGCKKPKKNGL